MAVDHDPNTNRFFMGSLGTVNKGCQCQSKWLLLVERGEVMCFYCVTDTPEHLRDAEKAVKEGSLMLVDGKYMFQANIAGWKSHAWEVETVEVDGKIYYKDPCHVFGLFDSESEIQNTPDGIYTLIQEYACYSSYHPEYGYEGDSDVAYLMLPYVDIEDALASGFLDEEVNDND